jgi:hypothetical protein
VVSFIIYIHIFDLHTNINAHSRGRADVNEWGQRVVVVYHRKMIETNVAGETEAHFST